MLAVTLTFSALFCVMFVVLGTIVGWLAKDYVLQRDSKYIPMHPEMFDENGQIIPDEVLAVRFENDIADPDDPLN